MAWLARAGWVTGPAAGTRGCGRLGCGHIEARTGAPRPLGLGPAATGRLPRGLFLPRSAGTAPARVRVASLGRARADRASAHPVCRSGGPRAAGDRARGAWRWLAGASGPCSSCCSGPALVPSAATSASGRSGSRSTPPGSASRPCHGRSTRSSPGASSPRCGRPWSPPHTPSGPARAGGALSFARLRVAGWLVVFIAAPRESRGPSRSPAPCAVTSPLAGRWLGSPCSGSSSAASRRCRDDALAPGAYGTEPPAIDLESDRRRAVQRAGRGRAPAPRPEAGYPGMRADGSSSFAALAGSSRTAADWYAPSRGCMAAPQPPVPPAPAEPTAGWPVPEAPGAASATLAPHWAQELRLAPGGATSTRPLLLSSNASRGRARRPTGCDRPWPARRLADGRGAAVRHRPGRDRAESGRWAALGRPAASDGTDDSLPRRRAEPREPRLQPQLDDRRLSASRRPRAAPRHGVAARRLVGIALALAGLLLRAAATYNRADDRRAIRCCTWPGWRGSSDEEVDRMAAELSKILEHVETMNELDLGGVEPTSHVVDLVNVLREDVPRESLPREPRSSRPPTRRWRVPGARARGGVVSDELLGLTAAQQAERIEAGEVSGDEVFEFWRGRAAATSSAPTCGWPRRTRRAGALPPVAVKDLFCVEGVPSAAARASSRATARPTRRRACGNLQDAGSAGARQDEPGRVRDGLLERELGLRPSAEPVGPDAGAGRLERRQRRGRGGRHGALGDRHGHRRLDPPAGASLCGIVGLKPTYGAVSRYGMIAFASSLDQCGPLTRDVTDAAILLGHLQGRDPCDSTSLGIPDGVGCPARAPRRPALRRLGPRRGGPRARRGRR